jgi:hypothetical protein
MRLRGGRVGRADSVFFVGWMVWVGYAPKVWLDRYISHSAGRHPFCIFSTDNVFRYPKNIIFILWWHSLSNFNKECFTCLYRNTYFNKAIILKESKSQSVASIHHSQKYIVLQKHVRNVRYIEYETLKTTPNLYNNFKVD